MKGGKTMKNIAFSCKIRQAFTESTEYIDGGEADIRLDVERIGGDDISENYSVKVKNTGKSDFLGIIHIKATAEKGSPKFFMPGFMYNRNTADMPSSGRKKLPQNQGLRRKASRIALLDDTKRQACRADGLGLRQW